MPEADATGRDAHAEDLELLRGAAVEGGRIAMGYFRQNPEVWMKLGQSPVSEADFAVDRFLRDALLSARPDYGWLSEETVDTAERLGRRRTFVVDPIDGTRGFLEGLDTWCVSVAIVEDGCSRAGVLECPARGETFRAMAGAGSYKNGVRLHVGPVGATVSIGGPKTLVDTLPPDLRDRLRRVRHVPSLAYRIAMIADRTIDATFVKPNAQDWDLAAADLILREAGGAIRNEDAEFPTYGGEATNHGVLVAGSGALLDIMTSAIAGRAI